MPHFGLDAAPMIAVMNHRVRHHLIIVAALAAEPCYAKLRYIVNHSSQLVI